MTYDSGTKFIDYSLRTISDNEGEHTDLPFPLATGLRRPSPVGERTTGRDHVLSPRERMVIELLADGLRVSRIADQMGISEPTVALHLRNARRKLRAATTPQAVARALLYGEITVRG